MSNFSHNSKITTNADDVASNAIFGDISYEDLAKIEGVSTIALNIKKATSSNFTPKNDRKSCVLSNIPLNYISFKNVDFLKRFISPRGRIISSRISGVKDRQKQRKLRLAIVHARFLGLLPYVKY